MVLILEFFSSLFVAYLSFLFSSKSCANVRTILFAVKLESIEAFCSDPGCMKYFTSAQCLKAHIQSCHRHVTCEVCGTKQLKKNLKRHLLTHEAKPSSERIKCSFEDCLHTFSTVRHLSVQGISFLLCCMIDKSSI